MSGGSKRTGHTASPVGLLTGEPGRRAALSLDRWYPDPPLELWSAITEADRLRRWLGPVEGDLRQGSDYRIAWSDEPDTDQVVTGVVEVCEAPSHLVVTWDVPGEASSRVRVRLEDADGGTRLLLEHDGLSRAQARGLGAGWHAYLDALGDVLGERATRDWFEVFQAVLPQYRAQLPEADDVPPSGMGEVKGDGILLRRRLATDLADAWTLVSDPDRIRRWFAPVSFERAAVGSPWATTWDDGHEYARGVIRRCEEPHLLEVTWTASDDADPASAESILRVQLREAGDGVELVLEHTGLAAADIVLYGPGWHTYLDRLPQGRHWPVVDWSARFEELRPSYAEAVRATRR